MAVEPVKSLEGLTRGVKKIQGVSSCSMERTETHLIVTVVISSPEVESDVIKDINSLARRIGLDTVHNKKVAVKRETGSITVCFSTSEQQDQQAA